MRLRINDVFYNEAIANCFYRKFEEIVLRDPKTTAPGYNHQTPYPEVRIF